MTTYRITLTPLEPYFFGNEKNFNFGTNVGQKAQSNYYIKSDYTPSQSTLLGMLRYLGLKHVNSDFKYTDQEIKDNNDAVGKESFKFDSTSEQCFGNIHRIYPLHIINNNTYYAKTPLDHNTGRSYSPFKEYTDTMLPTDFHSKDRDVSSYVNLDTLEIVDMSDIFIRHDRIGIKRFSTEEGFFKKQFISMKNGYSFCFFADLDGDWKDSLVYLGQNKSLFKVSFEKKDYDVKISKLFEKHPFKNSIAYCISDSFLDETVYNCCEFTAINTRDFRSLTTIPSANNYLKRFSKSSTLIHLIEAGSVFIVSDGKNNEFDLISNHHAKKIGFNNIWRG